MKLVVLDIEESDNCVADSLSVYNGNGLYDTDNLRLIRKMCLANSSFTVLNAENVMTVKFDSDFYVNKTGFQAFVRKGMLDSIFSSLISRSFPSPACFP